MRKKVFDPTLAKHQALQLFWKQGYAQTSMDDLVKEMGISRSSFYNTFGDKKTLYQSVIFDFAQLGEMAAQVLKAKKPIKSLLTDFFDMSFIKHGVSTDQGCLLVNTILEQKNHESDLALMASEFMTNIEEQIAGALKTAIERGELSEQLDVIHSASFIITIIKGLRVAAKEGKSKMELKRLFHSSLTILDHTEV